MEGSCPELLVPSPTALARAARCLAEGGLVLFPTETYYGAAVRAQDPAAVGRLVARKGRASSSPVPLIFSDEGAVRLVAASWPAAAARLAARYWPGPLTLVLPARPGLPDPVVGPRGAGMRVSSHAVAGALARALGGPITATSANRSGASPARTAAEAARALPGADLVLDGGVCPGGPPSTVVAIGSDGAVEILRQGAVHVQG